MSQLAAVADDATTGPTPDYPVRVLLAGIVARTWLWFVAGCVVVTLVPFLFGWRSYAVESGSMEPRLQVGDVVIASPNPSVDDVLGRVTVFTDPDNGKTKVHRVTAVNPNGTLTTQGDNNPTADPQPLPTENIKGMARLLVRWVGLPLIWAQTGQWLWLLLMLASLVLAGLAISRDQEDEDEEDPEGPDDDGDAATPLPTRLSEGGTGLSQAAATPTDPGLRRSVRRFVWARRLAYLSLLAVVLSVPTAGAAFAATTKSPSNTWTAGTWTYTTQVTGLTPWLYWKLDETTGTTAADTSGNGRTGTYRTNLNANAGGFTRGIVGANTGASPNRAVTLNGTTACINTASSTTMNAPAQLTEVAWFKTTTTNGGKILGFEMPQTNVAMPGSGGTYDRHIYMDGAGKVWFGVYNGGYFTVSSPAALNNGAWHMAAATMGAGGMALWIDGVKVGTSANTAGETTAGWFRAGCGNLGGWGDSWTGGNNPTNSTNPTQNRPFAGSLDEISIWQSVLTDTQIQSLWAAR